MGKYQFFFLGKIVYNTQMKKKNGLPDVSIIIPALNEADYIGYLLFSLSRQTYKNFEVIVSDGDSRDETIEIAKSFKKQLPSLITVISQKRSPAYQRNRGEEKAKYERLLFLDADIILPVDFLEKNLKEIKKRRLDLAHPVTFPLTKRIYDQYFHLLINWGSNILQYFYPMAAGWTIFSHQKAHRAIHGFDEEMDKIGEDTEYIQQAVKAGFKFGIIKSSPPFVSSRRYDSEGKSKQIKLFITQIVYFYLFGKHKTQAMVDRSYGDFRKLLQNMEKKQPGSSF